MSAGVRVRFFLLLSWGVSAAASSIHAAAPADTFQLHTRRRPQSITQAALRLRGGTTSPARSTQSSVQFVVESPNLADDEYIGIVGSHELLGNWQASKAMLLKKKASPFSDRTISSKRIELPAGQEVQYKFIIKTHPEQYSWDPSNPVNQTETWETIANRCVTPQEEGSSIVVIDSFDVESSGVHFSEASVPKEYKRFVLPQRDDSSLLASSDLYQEDLTLIALVDVVEPGSPAAGASIYAATASIYASNASVYADKASVCTGNASVYAGNASIYASTALKAAAAIDVGTPSISAATASVSAGAASVLGSTRTLLLAVPLFVAVVLP